MSGGKIKVPLVLRGAVGASTRGAQHAQCVEAWFTHTPGLKVVTPSTAYDAKGLLKSAIRDDNPVLFLEHKLLYGSKGVRKEPGGLDVMGEIPEEEYVVPLGVAAIRREGSDATVVANFLMVHRALDAAQELESEGISLEVIDPRTLVPMDTDTILKSVQKTGRLVIVEEDNKRGGWGSELAASVAEQAIEYLDGPVIRVAAPDTPVPFSPIMERYYVPGKENIIEAVRELLS
jgi:pyruvate dehydrogenase E1 component beta subunit